MAHAIPLNSTPSECRTIVGDFFILDASDDSSINDSAPEEYTTDVGDFLILNEPRHGSVDTVPRSPDHTSDEQQYLENYDLFEHSELDRTQASIRLLQIYESLSPDGLIACTLRHGTTDDEYICLSYRWGGETPVQPILINDQLFWVRSSLHDFLHIARRYPERSAGLPFWIDALSIRQDSISERNHQVAHMGQIYSRARSVHVWLGLMPEMPATFRTLAMTRIEHRKDWRRHKKDFIEHTHRIHKYLLHNAYWKRAWITQEVMLASEVLVLQDVEALDLKSLLRGLRNFKIDGSNTPFAPFSSISLHRMFADTSLIDLILQFRDRECQIPRDRIFALLSLCKEGASITVDYGQSDVDLAYQVLRACGTSLCLCTAIVIAETLGLNRQNTQHTSSSFADGGAVKPEWVRVPYIEFDLPDLKHSEAKASSNGKGVFVLSQETRTQIGHFCESAERLLLDWIFQYTVSGVDDERSKRPFPNEGRRTFHERQKKASSNEERQKSFSKRIAVDKFLVPASEWQIYKMKNRAKGGTVRIKLDFFFRRAQHRGKISVRKLCGHSSHLEEAIHSEESALVRVGHENCLAVRHRE